MTPKDNHQPQSVGVDNRFEIAAMGGKKKVYCEILSRYKNGESLEHIKSVAQRSVKALEKQINRLAEGSLAADGRGTTADVAHPPSSPATIDIEEVAKKILDLGLHSYGGYEENNRACIAQATTLITDLITEKENRARLDELENIEWVDEPQNTYMMMVVSNRITELEATLKRKGRDNG